MSRLLIAIALTAIVGPTARATDNTTTSHTSAVKIKLTIDYKILTATLADNGTARDFASLLPLTLTMNDLFGREKFGHLPRGISDKGKRTHTYEIGDIAYWSPGPDVAIYYHHDGEQNPDPGRLAIR